MWGKLCADIDDCTYYGIAIDTGIDKVKSEHILISVLYVREQEYVVPPLYSPKYRAYNGVSMATQFIECLKNSLGETRVLKLKFLMVDGSAVNHVARGHCEGFLKQIYNRISPVGQEDEDALARGFASHFPCISLLSCIGHMLNNVCKTTLKIYEDLPCFKFKRAFAHTFY